MLVEKMAVKKFLDTYPRELFEESFKIVFNDKSKEEIKVGEGEVGFTIILNESFNKKDFLKDPSIVLGEAYMDKKIEVEGDLYKCLSMIMHIRKELLEKIKTLEKNEPRRNDVSKEKQEQEVKSHYDLGNDFYKLWLDETMNYSCAYFKNPDDTLYQAQSNKVNHIINKLQLKDGMSLLDIGCGWGDLLIVAAKKYNIKGTGITLSQEQYKGFKSRIEEEGLEDRLDVKLMDYRDLKDSKLLFDRVVSVGMIEHVGNENYGLFLDNVKAVLKTKGVFLLHFISGGKESGTDKWMDKYIFPGGVIPSLREIIFKGVDRDFNVIDVESLRRHYIKTLLCWHDNFTKEEDTVKEMFDERFVRMWRLYLLACAANFNVGGIDLHQIVFTNGVNNTLAMTR
ncbi:Cyclopropane-fatty-acyl-phospholipid synthase [Aerococcus viridans]|uniref:SAM-dependent methyltransferase n=2 Tax=Aerococcus viridans TaxID=1377 RepID=A0AAU8UAI1_9LACT|nr:cyclopropane-fatty-acyl-phospholipid synthase family protein [Aerococcus viridans]AMC01838.1 SAM-dependent methyltransferase [Aerococcus viridans]EFG50007.1 Cyclopropane-fatty-acyl-phospholipid synthase [Aerococcus viridans ATCC 11563 = CCUG 4311]SUU11997.1 Cyclopropane-fatty-acyl-phospholipid synthase [Aerococcus viridans]